ncbi:MAG: hypothetical protein WCL10_18840 [Novosphingobium sp.]|uniref:hypothetical protein n=1 Tax=Novosphingobium sp. TaxID=1874826 RepID=UPI00301AFDAB
MDKEQLAALDRAATQGVWTVDWSVCTADDSDVAYAKKEGRKIEVGDALWRVAQGVGPLYPDHNHWTGAHLGGNEADAELVVALVNAYRAKQIVLIGPDAVATVGMALCQAALGPKACPCVEKGEFRCADAHPGDQARAAIAALGVK